MRIARASTEAAPAPSLFALQDDLAVPLPSAGADPLRELLADARAWAGLPALVADRLRRRQGVVEAGGLRLHAPLARPGKIVAVGLNYVDHSAEAGLQLPAEPLTFAKHPTSVIGPGEDVVVPTALTTQVDWEAELAVVIGRTCGPSRRGTLADVAGCTAANDVSARDLQFRDGQWTRAKSLDTFCPLGPVLVTLDELGDPGQLRIWASVNGQRVQDATTADMVFDTAALLDSLTEGMTLEPGDVVLTGTPPGVGAFRTPPVFLADGDVVTVGVEGVGELRNPVRHR